MSSRTPHTGRRTVPPLRSQVDDVASTLNAAHPSESPDISHKSKRVAYQGVPGAYSEFAALLAYSNSTTLPYESFEKAFLAVEQWGADRAVLPIENTLGGSIHRNYDLLSRHDLHIVGEVYLRVNHCLLALPGTKLEDITRVMSHPQALAQTEGYCMTNLNPGVVREAAEDTAGSAKILAEEKLAGVAAVASNRAAELYGLEVLAENIQDDSSNFTRFIALARDPVSPEEFRQDLPFKTSIVFSLEQGSGMLFKAMACFALRGIDLTKIESRPMRSSPLRELPSSFTFTSKTSLEAAEASRQAEKGPGSRRASFNYLFYLDFAASLKDRNALNAMRHLSEIAIDLRVLGSYPMDERLSQS